MIPAVQVGMGWVGWSEEEGVTMSVKAESSAEEIRHTKEKPFASR